MRSFKEFLYEEKTSETKSDKFEVEIMENVKSFIDTNKQRYPILKTLEVSHSVDEDAKYYSDVKVSNTANNKNVWIEVKLNKYANLGGPSFKYIDGQWICSTADEDNSLTRLYLQKLIEHSETFINFCREKLGNDFELPRDLPKVIPQWKKSHSIDDTDNDVQFITEKIELPEFGAYIAKFYQSVKREPVYYIQVDDDLYIIDENFNPLGLKTKDGNGLKTISQAYPIGRIQFRAKGIEKNGTYYYNITTDVKILANEEDQDEQKYSCSFKTPEKFPILEI